jgi:REP-associated tyrosine transposase
MSLSSLHVHLVFGTKNRQPTMAAALRPNLHAYLGGIVRELHGKAAIVNGTEDHVHLLATIPATLSVSDLLRLVKTNSSKWMNERGTDFAWQKGYAAFTVSTSKMPAVAAYIRGQEEHHRKRSFEDELIALLQRHGVSYDPKYLWE